MKGVKYIGQVFNQSGYAEAARNYILALHQLGVPVTVEAIRHNDQQPDLGRDGEVLASLVDRPIDYDRIVLHDTPDTWAHRLRAEPPGIGIVGCTVWETSGLHPLWTKACNLVDEVWVPSRWNAEVFERSGVRVPIDVMPHCMEAPDAAGVAPLELPGVPDGAFVFYSIFHWHERKNPIGLLAAYFAAFSGVHDVVLVLKTYFDWALPAGSADPKERSDAQRLQDEVAAFKRRMKLVHYPRVVGVTGILGRGAIQALHRRGDAFVLLQRAEGWGLPHFEAAGMAKPVVTTGVRRSVRLPPRRCRVPGRLHLAPGVGHGLVVLLRRIAALGRARSGACDRADAARPLRSSRSGRARRPGARARRAPLHARGGGPSNGRSTRGATTGVRGERQLSRRSRIRSIVAGHENFRALSAAAAPTSRARGPSAATRRISVARTPGSTSQKSTSCTSSRNPSVLNCRLRATGSRMRRAGTRNAVWSSQKSRQAPKRGAITGVPQAIASRIGNGEPFRAVGKDAGMTGAIERGEVSRLEIGVEVVEVGPARTSAERRDRIAETDSLVEDVAAVVLDHQRHRVARRERAAVGVEQYIDALAGDGGADEEEEEPIGIAGAQAWPEVESRPLWIHQAGVDAVMNDVRLGALDAARGRLLGGPARVDPELVADVVDHLGEAPRIGSEVPGPHRDQTRRVGAAQLGEVVAVVVMDDAVVATIESRDGRKQANVDAVSRQSFGPHSIDRGVSGGSLGLADDRDPQRGQDSLEPAARERRDRPSRPPRSRRRRRGPRGGG